MSRYKYSVITNKLLDHSTQTDCVEEEDDESSLKN